MSVWKQTPLRMTYSWERSRLERPGSPGGMEREEGAPAPPCPPTGPGPACGWVGATWGDTKGPWEKHVDFNSPGTAVSMEGTTGDAGVRWRGRRVSAWTGQAASFALVSSCTRTPAVGLEVKPPGNHCVALSGATCGEVMAGLLA